MSTPQLIACDNLDQTPAIGSGRLASMGDWLRAHGQLVRRLQWGVVLFYAVLLIVSAAMPLPASSEGMLDDLRLFAQFLFWGVWWPFVLLSVVLFGRIWCGLLCPEGSLSEWASEHGRGAGVPRWMRWAGWPTVGFMLTTLYGQLISVYDYPQAALLILGGSTLAAVLVGYLYGRGKRVWCRYLCPVSGVFRLLARLAPMHYRVDPEAWQANLPPHHPVPNCAPLVDIRRMRGAADCHACGRCSGQRHAVRLSVRSMNHEIVEGGSVSAWDLRLLLYGVIGLAIGAFQWSVSPWFVWGKLLAAEWLIDRDMVWALQTDAPWWLLTHHPANNDVFSCLDAALITLYIGLCAVLIGGALHGCIALAVRASRSGKLRVAGLAQSLIPAGGAGLFLGLSATTVKLLGHEGVALAWAGEARAAVLLSALTWSVWLGMRLLVQHTQRPIRLGLASLCLLCANALIGICWWLQFWGW